MIERVSFTSRDGDPVPGALAAPAGDDRVPGLVVIQEWWGLNEQIQRTCERFAAEGFLAVAPDLYRGKVTTDADEASHWMGALDWGRALADLAGAVTYLRDHPRSTGKVAVTGFCMGGALALASACQLPGLAAVVPFYGVPGEADWAKVEAPIQAHFARIDDWATPEKAEAIQRAVTGHGGAMELHLYEAQHAFMNEARPEVHAPEAARQAWQRTVAFLRAHTA
jgi:carboxymethylenebutenolidase